LLAALPRPVTFAASFWAYAASSGLIESMARSSSTGSTSGLSDRQTMNRGTWHPTRPPQTSYGTARPKHTPTPKPADKRSDAATHTTLGGYPKPHDPKKTAGQTFPSAGIRSWGTAAVPRSLPTGPA